MSDIEATPIITAPVVVKEKDPKRVAAGKKLAAISKDAKMAKARRIIEAEKVVSADKPVIDMPEINYGFAFGVVGMVAAIASIYYARRDDARAVALSQPPPAEVETQSHNGKHLDTL